MMLFLFILGIVLVCKRDELNTRRPLISALMSFIPRRDQNVLREIWELLAVSEEVAADVKGKVDAVSRHAVVGSDSSRPHVARRRISHLIFGWFTSCCLHTAVLYRRWTYCFPSLQTWREAPQALQCS